jgi:hypothetical protein
MGMPNPSSQKTPAKDVGVIRDEKALRQRWLMKTVNVRSLQPNFELAHLLRYM